jgi:hypothetical protein
MHGLLCSRRSCEWRSCIVVRLEQSPLSALSVQNSEIIVMKATQIGLIWVMFDDADFEIMG